MFQKLIKKEFSSKNNEEKALSDNRKTNTGEHLNVQRRLCCSHQQ
jgi:hypothetical protein